MPKSTQTYPEIPSWEFSVEEVSAGVYWVKGCDSLGRSVETTGTDPEKLLSECVEAASKLQRP